MKKSLKFIMACMTGVVLAISANAQSSPGPARPPHGFKSQVTTVNGVKLHYVTGGKGEALVLLHGFGQNWYMWNRLLPELSKHFTIIAPDLPGLGESGKPASGYDKKTMAADIHALVKHLGYNKANVAGHDIGLMVAYAYAAQYREEVKKLVLMDALIPGVEPMFSKYSGKAWWWGFFSWPASGQLVNGLAGLFLTNFWPVVAFNKNAFTDAEKAEFIRAYSAPGATTGSFRWFAAFKQDAKDNQLFLKAKLKMPVMAMGGDQSTGTFLGSLVRVAAINVTEVKIKDSGHWLVQEQTQQVQRALLNFLLKK